MTIRIITRRDADGHVEVLRQTGDEPPVLIGRSPYPCDRWPAGEHLARRAVADLLAATEKIDDNG